MQEEVTQKTIAFSVRTARLTADVLKILIRSYINSQRKKGHNSHAQGKQSVKKLIGQNAGVSNIEINDGNIKAFDSVARKYGVDYAVKKDKSGSLPRYLVFFKGRDTDVLNQAFREFVGKELKQKKAPSIIERLNHFKDVLAKGKHQERSKEHQKDRGQSL